MEIVCHPTAVGRFARRVHDALGVLLPVGAEAAVQGVFFQTDAQNLPSPPQQQADIRRADAGFGGGGGGQDDDSLGIQETRLPLPARDGFVRRLVAEAVPGQFAQKALCRVGILPGQSAGLRKKNRAVAENLPKSSFQIRRFVL